jgi:cytochrome P450
MWPLDAASADTTSGTIAGFLLNMVLHPETQQKAQAEIDRVVGSERLPSFAE